MFSKKGGGWSGDLNVLDWSEIEHANYFHEIHIKRFKASEMEVPGGSDKFTFPLAEGTLRQPSSTKSRPKRIRPSRASNNSDVVDPPP